jgi:coenzyme F420-reducing hydrogenase beta subunit
MILNKEKHTTTIHLADKKLCTGCSACAVACSKQCISMQEDNEGFLQPIIDNTLCISCRKCENVCPVLKTQQVEDKFDTKAYAIINKNDDIRAKSSSGGVFFPLAKWVIEQGGVVFGARWNDKWEVVHDYAEDMEGIKAFMRSKYVQSNIGNTYVKVKQFLKDNRIVLFSGTPCQVGGLVSYLGNKPANLIIVDIICHGVPSPKVWRKYLNEKCKDDQILDINFREKGQGWKSFQNVTTTTTTTTTYKESQRENLFFRAFINNVILRKSCYNCSFKSVKRISDITLADYWGVHIYSPQMDDDKGTSLVFIHTIQGERLLNEIKANFILETQDISKAIEWNSAMIQSVPLTERRKYFFKALDKNKFSDMSSYIDKDRLWVRIKRKVIKNLKKL